MYFHFVLASIHFHQHYNNQLRILLVGPVGAGKSSFFNSIFRVRPSPAQQTRVRRSRCHFSHQHTNKPALGRHLNTSSTVNCVFISLAIPKLEHQGWEKGETLRHNGTGGNDQSGSGHRGFGQHPQGSLPGLTFQTPYCHILREDCGISFRHVDLLSACFSVQSLWIFLATRCSRPLTRRSTALSVWWTLARFPCSPKKCSTGLRRSAKMARRMGLFRVLFQPFVLFSTCLPVGITHSAHDQSRRGVLSGGRGLKNSLPQRLHPEEGKGHHLSAGR